MSMWKECSTLSATTSEKSATSNNRRKRRNFFDEIQQLMPSCVKRLHFNNEQEVPRYAECLDFSEESIDQSDEDGDAGDTAAAAAAVSS